MLGESYVFRDYVTKTKMLSYSSLRPVHQICLSQERLVMAKLNYILDRLQIPRRLLSFRNDGASIQPGKHLKALRDALTVTYGGLTKLQRHEKLRRCVRAPIEALSNSETPVFRLKEYKLSTDTVTGQETQEPLEPDMPGGELKIRECPPFEVSDRTWHVTYEPQEGPDDFYERVVRPHVIEQGLPSLITGPAGSGKSHVLLRCEADLKAAGHTVEKISLTHVACRRLEDAKTAHSFIQRHVLHGRFNGWLLIDECSMLPAPVVTLLENLATMGVKFVLFGDWNQLSPPMNRWRATTIRGDIFQGSRLLHIWTGGREFRLARCRRSNREHYDFSLGLLGMPLDDAKELCRDTFHPASLKVPVHLQAETHIVLSHRRRTYLNDACQVDAVKRYRVTNPDGLVVEITAVGEDTGLNHQQDFELCEGTKLIGANNDLKSVVNGGFMTVGVVRATDCDILDEFGAEFTLTHAQVARCSRLAWAITVTSSQSREFDGKVCLWDLGSKYYSRAHLYVAATRVKHGSLLIVAE
jgi:hypothetical protein